MLTRDRVGTTVFISFHDWSQMWISSTVGILDAGISMSRLHIVVGNGQPWRRCFRLLQASSDCFLLTGDQKPESTESRHLHANLPNIPLQSFECLYRYLYFIHIWHIWLAFRCFHLTLTLFFCSLNSEFSPDAIRGQEILLPRTQSPQGS